VDGKQSRSLSCAAERVTLRPARDVLEDSAAFCDLSNSLYDRKVDARYYAWQFFAAPWPCVLTFATSERGELIGCCGFQLRQTNTGRYVAWAIDNMIAPRFQGKGLFRALAGYATEQAVAYEPAALCAMVNARAKAAYTCGLGWTLLKAIPTYSRAPAGTPARLDFCLEDSEIGADPCSANVRPSLISTVRSPVYLSWRFGSNPRYRYRSTVDRKTGTVFISKTFLDEASGRCVGDLVDVIPGDGPPGCMVQAVSSAAAKISAGTNAGVVAWLETKTEFDSAAIRAGFRATEQVRYWCGRPMRPCDHRFTDPETWFLTMADAEVY
jgi:Acetyltransferase (GNAT) family